MLDGRRNHLMLSPFAEPGGHTAMVSRRRPDQPLPSGERPGKGRDLLLAFPIGVVAAALVWVGDQHLTHRDWATGAVVFALGMLCAGFTVRQLRRAGLVR